MRLQPIAPGTKYGRLTVLARSDGPAEVKYECDCECGTRKVVRGNDLKSGRTRSCGCLKAEGNKSRWPSDLESLRARFLKRMGDPDENGCRVWLGYTSNGTQHGRVQHKGRGQIASRVSYELFVGPIPDGLLVCHKCDNRPCVNPDHLFLGTYQDNSDDMYEKGRQRHLKGEENTASKLTAEAVADIRSSSLPLRRIAGKYGITYGHAGKIRRGELWQQ